MHKIQSSSQPPSTKLSRRGFMIGATSVGDRGLRRGPKEAGARGREVDDEH